MADAVQLLPQGRVPEVIEIQAADEIAAALGMGVRSHYGRKTLAQAQNIEDADLVFPLVAILQGDHSLPYCWGQYTERTLE